MRVNKHSGTSAHPRQTPEYSDDGILPDHILRLLQIFLLSVRVVALPSISRWLQSLSRAPNAIPRLCLCEPPSSQARGPPARGRILDLQPLYDDPGALVRAISVAHWKRDKDRSRISDGVFPRSTQSERRLGVCTFYAMAAINRTPVRVLAANEDAWDLTLVCLRAPIKLLPNAA